MKIIVSILPQKYIVDRIGGNEVETISLTSPGHSPETFEISARHITQLSESEVYFTVGVPFENSLMGKIIDILPDLKIIGLTSGLIENGTDHTEGTTHHDHGGLDPHVWLDPIQFDSMCSIISNELCHINPESADKFRQNREEMKSEVIELYTALDSLLRPYEGRSFLVFHPAFGHFAKKFGLKQIAVEREGKEPGPLYLSQLVSTAKEENINTIFIQPQFARKSAIAIANEIDAELVEIDPLAYDYFPNMRDVALKLIESFQDENE